MFNVSYDVLRYRLSGKHKPASTAHEHQMTCTVAQEEVLLDWMFLHAEEGHPWSGQRILLKVRQMTGEEKGPAWVKKFKDRHSDVLKFCGTSGLDPKRAHAFNPTAIRKHFTEYGDAREKFGYKITNIYNLDEKGNQIGGGRKRTGKKYFVPRSDRAKYKTRDASLALVTVIECCCADGSMLKPGFIFHGGTGKISTYERDWFEVDEDISIGLTANGWTDDLQCEKWFEESFIPQARARADDPSERILLCFDGHGSHVTDRMRILAKENNIDFHLFVAHTTHKCQPLDVGVFGPQQRKWTERMEEIAEETGEGLQRADFVKEYMAVRAASITEVIVKAAWRKTGLEPFNADIFTDRDFTPSRVTSKHARLPASFPATPSPVAPQPSSNSPTPLSSVLPGAEVGPTYNGDIDPELLEDNNGHETSVALGNVSEPSISQESVNPTTSDGPPESPAPDNQAAMPLPNEGDKVPEFHRSPIHRRLPLAEQCRILKHDLDACHSAYLSEFTLRQKAVAHCSLASAEIESLKSRLNTRQQKSTRKSRRFQSSHNFLMGEQAEAEFAERLRENNAKAAAKAAKEAKRNATDEATRRRRTQLAIDRNIRFRTIPKRKADVEDLAYLLHLPLDGTVATLTAAIKSHLQETPLLKTDSRFAGLY
ncbi:DDE-domain-containing protein, partial [Punctularia strigosozonata HHB-11173 SS5]